MSMKTDFDPIDKIKAAYFYHVLGLSQAQITAVLNISNNGRTNEAIKEIEGVVGLSDGGYRGKRNDDR